jgi:hypothetical protein
MANMQPARHDANQEHLPQTDKKTPPLRRPHPPVADCSLHSDGALGVTGAEAIADLTCNVIPRADNT